MTTDLVLDPWTYYDYKGSFNSPARGASALAPTWVGEHSRRLRAYTLLESYCRNAARWWVDGITDAEKALRREYGDPNTIVDQVLDSLLGSDQSIYVPDAHIEEPSAPAQTQQERLLEWADKERFVQKMNENERNAVKLGDGCYVLGWDEEVERDRLRIYDPGFYFPVLTDVTEEFPTKVHIAYEFETRGPLGNIIKKIRRITWELVDVTETDRVEDNALRRLPWNNKPTRWTCLYSDGTWVLGTINIQEKEGGPEFFDPTDASWDVLDRDLEIDYIPVVHIPNTISEAEHYGTSSLANVLQIIDDLISTDSDLQAAAATTGTPPIAISKASAPRDDDGNILTYGPGTVLETGDGTATVIDTSRSLDALLKLLDALLQRLAVNSKVPESLLGRVKPNEVPSGIALTLSFSPHSSMIRRMRLARKDKYALLLKFVCRSMMKSGDLSAISPVNVVFGSFLPADKQETVELVTRLLEAHAISTETAVRMLLESGIPIDDAVDEVIRIIEENFDAANELLNATGDVNVVRDRLGLEPLPIEEATPPGPEPETEEL